MSEELIIEVNKEDRKIDLRPRNDFYDGEHIHRASHLILFNLEGKMLLPRRAKTKRWYPLLYDFAVGGTVEDETYTHCIKREVSEELGIVVPIRKVFKYFSSDSGKDSAFRMIFIAKTNQPIEYNEEVESVRWIFPNELKKDIQQNPQNYAPYFIIGLEKYFSTASGT